jgi:hypothetical protein
VETQIMLANDLGHLAQRQADLLLDKAAELEES